MLGALAGVDDDAQPEGTVRILSSVGEVIRDPWIAAESVVAATAGAVGMQLAAGRHVAVAAVGAGAGNIVAVMSHGGREAALTRSAESRQQIAGKLGYILLLLSRTAVCAIPSHTRTSNSADLSTEWQAISITRQ